MKRIVIDSAEATSLSDVHKIFREALSFPDYYGNNLDALYDMLSTWQTPLTIEVRTAPDKCFLRLLRVLKDAAGENSRISLVILPPE